MAALVRQLLYVSQATTAMTTEDCESILSVARECNKRDGITGFLAYLPNGTIIQVLEGDSDAVSRTYKRISNDHRHTHVTTIIDTEGEPRLFSKWFMGFRMLEQSEVAMLPDFFNLRRGGVPRFLDGTPIAIKVLKTIFVANTTYDYGFRSLK